MGISVSAAHRLAARLTFAAVLCVGVSLLFQAAGGAERTGKLPADTELDDLWQGPSVETPHAYFEALSRRPERIQAFSLRDQRQLDSLVKRGPSTFFRYVWPADDYRRAQDGAKLIKPPRAQFDPERYGPVGDEGVPGNQTLRVPLGVTSGRLLITWDFWWGEEFQTQTGNLDAWKSFFVTSGKNVEGSNVYWLAHDHIANANAAAGEVSRHHDGPVGVKSKAAPGVIRADPFQPTGLGAVPSRSFATMFNRWTRYWLDLRMDVPGSAFTEWSQVALNGTPLTGTWDMVSLWVADEQREPVRLLYRVPAARIDPMLVEFRLALNTSTNNRRRPGTIGTLIAYARNVVVLHNAELREPGPRP
jgi:hypothetical protein